LPLHVPLSSKLESFYLGTLGNGFGTSGSTWGAGLGTGTSSSFCTPGAFGAGFGALGLRGTGAVGKGSGALESTHISLLLQVLHNP
jgi:hypothetical protein